MAHVRISPTAILTRFVPIESGNAHRRFCSLNINVMIGDWWTFNPLFRLHRERCGCIIAMPSEGTSAEFPMLNSSPAAARADQHSGKPARASGQD
jgi:hypothetical protein